VKETITKEGPPPRSALHQRAKHPTLNPISSQQPGRKMHVTTRAEITSRRQYYWDSLSGSLSTVYKYGWVCPTCFGSKKKPKGKKQYFLML